MLAIRRARRDPIRPGILEQTPAGQAALTAEELAWLRAVPDELVLDAVRPGDVYVCHGLPGNPFESLWPATWPAEPIYGSVSDEVRRAALEHPPLAAADLVLCGHSVAPFVQPEWLPNGRRVIVVRASGWPRQDDRLPRTSAAILTPSASGWRITIEPVLYTPRG
jgi:hypothetical protein